MNRNSGSGGGGDRKGLPRPLAPSVPDDDPTQVLQRPPVEAPARRGRPALRPAAGAPAARLGLPRPPLPATRPSSNEERTTIMHDAPARSPAVRTSARRAAPAPQPSQPSQRTRRASPHEAPSTERVAPHEPTRRPASQRPATAPYAQPPVAVQPAFPSAPPPPTSSQQGAVPRGQVARPASNLPTFLQAPGGPPRQAASQNPNAPYAHGQPGTLAPAASSPRALGPHGSPAFPSHFSPPAHGAPPAVATAARSGLLAPAGLAPGADAVPQAQTEPGSVMAASVFLGLPLALAILIVAVLSLR